MSVDLQNATTSSTSLNYEVKSLDQNQSVSFTAYTGTADLLIRKDLLTTPNGIGLNADGIAYDDGTTITSTSWDIITDRIAYLSAIAPNNINPTILAVNDTISIQNADSAPTRVISTTAGASAFGIEWVGDGLPFIMTTLDATNLQIKDTTLELSDSITPLLTTMTASTLTSGASSASWASIIAGVVPTLTQVLTAGNDATGASIINVNDIQLSTINGSAYPPAVAGLDIVLLNGNTAGVSNMDMNNNNITSVNNINVNTINNLTPTTIGLVWGDFAGTNAFTNLPNQSYSVDNGTGLQTDQKCDYFRASSTALNGYNELTATGMEIIDLNSSTSTLYQSNNLTIQNGTAYTITQGSGQNVNINCGQLVVNGVPFKVPIYYETHINANFGIGGGTFSAIGSPFTWGGLIPSQSYSASIQFSMSCDTYESSSSVYLDYSNSSGSWSSNTYSSSSYPCPQTGASNTFSGASGYSCFTIIDSIQFTADSFGQLNIQLNAGHNSGFWNTNYRWTFIGTILQP